MRILFVVAGSLPTLHDICHRENRFSQKEKKEKKKREQNPRRPTRRHIVKHRHCDDIVDVFCCCLLNIFLCLVHTKAGKLNHSWTNLNTPTTDAKKCDGRQCCCTDLGRLRVRGTEALPLWYLLFFIIIIMTSIHSGYLLLVVAELFVVGVHRSEGEFCWQRRKMMMRLLNIKHGGEWRRPSTMEILQHFPIVCTPWNFRRFFISTACRFYRCKNW